MNYTSVYKDIRKNKENGYSLLLRINNQLYKKDFTNINELLDFCKEKELKAMFSISDKKQNWSED